ncbi:MAG: hypothetical protein KGJ53_16180 [Alphaproteobacteria bacterium]|nr:hypothetical protein [Alphaproteobacteria bacterium]MDE2164699.1 hypothetical protein [Alphaproteobacteria bacterium]
MADSATAAHEDLHGYCISEEAGRTISGACDKLVDHFLLARLPPSAVGMLPATARKTP